MRGEPFRWNWDYAPGHLWFLQALLLFALIYLVYRAWADRDPTVTRFQIFSNQFPTDRALIISIVILAALTFIVRVKYPVGEWIFGLQLAHFVHYTFSFFVGILAYRGDWLNRLGRNQAHRWGVVALVTLPFFFVVAILGGALEGDAALGRFLGGFHWQALSYNIWEAILFIAILTFLLYFFRERLGKTGPIVRVMAASVFTVYIIHQTILIAFNILFLQINIPTILKFPLVSLFVVPICFGLAALIRKIPYAHRVLG